MKSINEKKSQDYRSSIIKSRSDLIDLLPLQTPLSITIGVTNRCNFGCVYCPTGDYTLAKKSRPNGLMSQEVFDKIVDDLSEFPQSPKKISLVGDGEPLLHPNYSEFLEKLFNSGVSQRIETTSNASLLERHPQIFKWLSGITFSIQHVNDSGYKSVTRNFSSFQKIVDNIVRFRRARDIAGSQCQIHCKILDLGLSESEREDFFKIFGPLSDTINIDSPVGWASQEVHDFSLGLADGKTKEGFDREEVLDPVCSQPFMYQKIQWNGSVVACCVDWKHETIVGDVKTESLIEIWNGQRMRDMRNIHIEEGGRKNHPACANCDWIWSTNPKDRLTAHRERLATLYRK